jgi:hypothetical protein
VVLVLVVAVPRGVSVAATIALVFVLVVAPRSKKWVLADSGYSWSELRHRLLSLVTSNGRHRYSAALPSCSSVTGLLVVGLVLVDEVLAVRTRLVGELVVVSLAAVRCF